MKKKKICLVFNFNSNLIVNINNIYKMNAEINTCGVDMSSFGIRMGFQKAGWNLIKILI